MSLSDTAEFWNDVKRNRQDAMFKRVFVHKKDLECGHYHVIDTENDKKVDCYACLKILKARQEAEHNV